MEHPAGVVVGAKVRKNFPGAGWFNGEIVELDDADGAEAVILWDDDEYTRVKYARVPKILVAAPAAPATKAPAARATKADDEVLETVTSRRPKRAVKSTGVWVGKHFVKKSNLYDLEGGERSVWDQELGGERTWEGASASAPAKRPAAARPAAAKKPRGAGAAAAELDWCDAAAAKGPRNVVPPFEATPAYVRADMRPYQLEGLRYLAQTYEDGVSAILADEMGLGKTLQTLSFLSYLKHEKSAERAGPSLVVCPLSVLSSWLVEASKFTPDLRIIKLHSADVAERERLKKRLRDVDAYDVVVTTFEMAKSPAMASSLGSGMWWRYVVLDEGHIIKNELSDISRAVRKLHCERALLLTGTPLQNDLHELWALLNFLFPDVFPDARVFDAAFDRGGGAGDPAVLRKAHAMMGKLMLRRVKGQVETNLPPKLETKILCPLAESQRWWYKRLLLRQSSLLAELERSATGDSAPPATGSWKKLQSLLMQLRKCCNHPYLFEGADPDPGVTDDGLVKASGKLDVLDRLLTKLKAKGHRCVLFSQFTSTLDILDDVLRYRGYEFSRLDGGTNRVQRSVDIAAFNQRNSKVFLFLMSTRAGGLGVNLQTADTCILYDSDWNPQADVQAMARVHRIGQTRPVHVYRLVTAGTVEERIVQRAEKKLYLDSMVNRDQERGGGAARQDGPSQSELLGALTFGAGAIVNGTAGKELTDGDLEAILDRSRTSDSTLGCVEGGQAHRADAFESTAEAVSLRTFEGEEFGTDKALKDASLADLSSAFIVEEKRSRTLRMKQEHVVGVGLVNVLTKEYGDGNEPDAAEAAPVDAKAARWEAAAAKAAMEAIGGRQIAGRDYDHEEHCLLCWDGGDLICCDQCPGAYHAECLEKLNAQLPTKKFGCWGCPHHSCRECGRKAGAAGGLLFRCQVCPEAYCEDHLPPTATIVGKCDRFAALGQNHPKQACFVLRSDDCLGFAKGRGLVADDVGYGEANAVAAAAGMDTTADAAPPPSRKRPSEGSSSSDSGSGATKKKKKTPPKRREPKLRVDDRSDWDRIPEDARARLGDALRRKRFAVGVGTAVDAVHAALFADDESKGTLSRTTADLAAEIATWRGAESEAAAAALFLRLTRLFETWKSYEVDALVHALQFLKLKRSTSDHGLAQRKPLAEELGRIKSRALHELLAHFLVNPRQGSLWCVALEDGGGFQGSGVTTYDLAPPPLLRAHYGVHARGLLCEVGLGQTYVDAAGKGGKRLSITHDRYGRDRPADLTLGDSPAELGDSPAAPPSASSSASGYSSGSSSASLDCKPKQAPKRKGPCKAVEVRRVGATEWRKFESQMAAIAAFPDLSATCLSSLLKQEPSKKPPKFEARRVPSPDTVIDLTSSPNLLKQSAAAALKKVQGN
ncbi:helicase [Aureococcus anophagefferens]|nr:helicase [Aureococcus anophagefferens]